MIKNAKYKMKDIFLKMASMPLSGFLYRKIYSKAVKRGVNNFNSYEVKKRVAFTI